jgi:HPt (histidine-containing phosphotransfer) domain-containing protein
MTGIEEYRKENRDTLNRLDAAFRENEYADAIQIVHKIRASSGSIEPESLREAA